MLEADKPQNKIRRKSNNISLHWENIDDETGSSVVSVDSETSFVDKLMVLDIDMASCIEESLNNYFPFTASFIVSADSR